MQSSVLPTPDGDDVTLLTLPGATSGSPVLLLLHGLEGSARSHYLGGLIAAAAARGWQVTVLLFRTCDGRLNRSRRTYHSGETSDLDTVVRHLADEHPGAPIGIVGVSLGGNVLLKWLGEHQQRTPAQVRVAAAVSAPFDLARSSRAIDSGFARLYQWNFLRSLRRKALAKAAQFPGSVPAERIARVRTMWEFDDVFTAPVHGFRDAGDYYRRSSSIHFLGGIRRPTLLLSAFDDPFYYREVLVEAQRISEANPLLTPEFLPRGGHVGFVGGAPWKPEYYLDRRVIGFLAAHLEPDARTG